ncbi:hypothetical protein FRB94_014621 [Tulasnella sp. JGI-2019a]|nr:hypothetical protein FRB93_002811 [Tulasnella sp. JGI-2019a]KAG9007148.1 hypothetical protein FRB94_014621 [Tulasnella sp. JGI-2019a]
MADDGERARVANFAKFDLYMDCLNRLIALDLVDSPTVDGDETWEEGYPILTKMLVILDGMQEQAYLLDPYLERMLAPAFATFRAGALEDVKGLRKNPRPNDQEWMPEAIYQVIKTRGAKTVGRYFPHTVEDLEVALETLKSSNRHPTWHWQRRYVVLLWLSLIAMIPFDLALFDTERGSGTTFIALEDAGRTHLLKAGLERDAAALLLARLYARKDCRGKVVSFAQEAIVDLQKKADPFVALGTLQVLSELTKSGGSLDPGELLEFRGLILEVKSHGNLTQNTLVQKWKVKLISRLAMSELPGRVNSVPKKRLIPSKDEGDMRAHLAPDFEVSETVEQAIEELLEALQDRDTTVRWSAAKGLARIAERLPSEYSAQILQSVIGLYDIHSESGALKMEDLPAASEGTWHGATLACAELARRGLVPADELSTVLDWMKKALSYDIRKGAHSIGSNVRDATAYVLWSMARAQDAASIKPFALDLARRLVATSLFDREVQIRRAASAAFQENVGRMVPFPHGIEIIGKADFFTVSVRRNAFELAAPQVARHLEYRDFLLHHLFDTTLKHWDPAMREAASTAIRRICELDLASLGPSQVAKAAALTGSIESEEIHGGLVTLAELAMAYKQSQRPELEAYRFEIFKTLSSFPPTTFSRYRNERILEAACKLISGSISDQAFDLTGAKTAWQDVIRLAMSHREVSVQQAAADAMRHPHGVVKALNCLLNAVDKKSPGFSSNIDARQNAFDALPKILTELGASLSRDLQPLLVNRIFEVFLAGLDDYTTDQRGDVGSWLRMSSIRGAVSVVTLYRQLTQDLDSPEAWLPSKLFRDIVAGIFKQAAERLDNVRQVAVDGIVGLLQCEPMDGPGRWTLQGEDAIRHELIELADPLKSWGDGSWTFPKLVHFLVIEEYRQSLLLGFVMSIGSRGEGAAHPASTSLVEFAVSLPATVENGFSVQSLAQDVLKVMLDNATSNIIFIPTLQTFIVLLEGRILDKVASTSAGVDVLRALLACAVRNMGNAKSAQRVMTAAKLVSGLVGVPAISAEAAKCIPTFLCHKFPKVRTSTAEDLYLAIQSLETEVDGEVEELLLETTWNTAVDDLQEPAGKIVAGLLASATLD